MFVHTGFVGSEAGRPKMNWDELRTLSASPLFRAESQTVNHPEDLTQMDPADVDAEFRVSKKKLEKGLGSPCAFLAYPNGKFNEAVAAQAREAGYQAAFTEELLVAEDSPSIWRVARWVHTRYQDAWRAANP
jgi:peptidoglycan/xylan/chitin deacetylase (PgdA/CDA1 family)